MKATAIFCLFCFWSVSYAQDIEKLFWESVDCIDSAQVKAYLDEYPNGKYIGNANLCLENIHSRETSQNVRKVPNLLEKCASLVLRNNLTAPAADNAYTCYKNVLSIEPNNYEAAKGLQKIEHTFAIKAMNAASAGNLDSATKNLKTLQSINPTHPSLIVIQSAIINVRSEKKDSVVDSGSAEVISAQKPKPDPEPEPEPEPQIFEKPKLPQVPSREALVELAADAINVFDRSVGEKSMARFYNFISLVWQSQTSIKSLDNVFRPFYEWGGDLTMLGKDTLRFDQPVTIDDDGIMLVKGHYPTRRQQGIFELKFLHEKSGWKMLGFNINIE